MSFHKGKLGESIVFDLLEKAGFSCVYNAEKNYKYDILAYLNDDISYKIEVKNDEYSLQSGNVAIENWNTKKDKKSGLTSTNADIWCHIIDKPYFTSVKRLKSFCKDNKPFKKVERGGDKNARLLIYKIEKIKPIFYSLEEDENVIHLKEILEELVCE